MARSDGNYLVIRGYVDGTIQGERSFDTQQEAEYYGKQMLAYIKKMNPKAKKVTVDIDSMTNHSPGSKIKTLASRPGAPDTFAVEDRFYFKGKKEKFAQEWTASDDRDADRVIQAMKELETKCSKKRSEIFETETKIIPRVIALATAAKKEKNQRYLLAAINTASHADNVRYSFSHSGEKAKMARNPEFDTDEVKNILHKESSDAEWGIDREVKGRGFYTYNAYHAYIGEPVVTKRFNTRGEAEKWLEKQNAARHPNKRKLSRSGEKAKFQLPNAEAYKQKELLRTATVNANNLTHQLFGLGQTIKSTGEQAQRMSQHYQTLIQDAQTPKEMAMVAAEIVKYAGKMARDLSASLREPIK